MADLLPTTGSRRGGRSRPIRAPRRRESVVARRGQGRGRRLVDAEPRRVTAYLNERQAGKLPVGAHVDVRSANRHFLPSVKAVVEEANPEIHVIAYSADLVGRQAAFRGQRVRLVIQGDHDLIGGETVYLSPETADWLGMLLRRIGVLPPPHRPQTARYHAVHPAAN